jgi:hypothetical protein
LVEVRWPPGASASGFPPTMEPISVPEIVVMRPRYRSPGGP